MVCAGAVVPGGVLFGSGQLGSADVQVGGEHVDLAARVEAVQQAGGDGLLHPADAVGVGGAPGVRIVEGVHDPVGVHEREHAKAQDRPVGTGELEDAAVVGAARFGDELDAAVRTEEPGEHHEQHG
jgi:hypothetical protein